MEISGGNNEIQALIALMDEPDNAVFQQVKEHLLMLGSEIIPQLEQAWENTFDSLIQDRIEEIIHNIQFDQLKFDVGNWKLLNSNDLLKGFLLISRYQYPEINEASLIAQIEQLKWETWLELNENLTALEKVKVINHVLFSIHKFGANKDNISALQNYFINNLLETQRGNPLSLGILYMIICQKLEIPVYGVDLPGHFVLAYTREVKPEDESLQAGKKQVLFYINPVKRGIAFTRLEVEQYLAEIKAEDNQAYFLPCDNIIIINRLISNLIEAYKSFNLEDKAAELEQLKEILSE